MPSRTRLQFASRFQLSTADLQLFRTNSFRLIQFRKNASANPLESHTFKTKDLKPFRYFQKKVGWTPCFPPDAHLQSAVTTHRSRALYASPDSIGTNHKSLRLSPLISALTSKRAAKSFTSNTYEKHTGGEGVPPSFEFRLSSFGQHAPARRWHESPVTNHESPVTNHDSRLTRLLRLSTMPVSSMNVCGSIGLALGPAAARWAAMFMGPKTSGL